MDIPALELNTDVQTDRYPLLKKCMESSKDCECIIDITRNDDVSSSSSHDEQPPRIDPPPHEDRPSSNTLAPAQQSSSSTRLNSRDSTSTGRGDGYDHRNSPLNSGLWISVELVVTVSQIIASVVVLSLSRNEHPKAPLFAWVVGYASGCVATLPLLYWRYHNRNQVSELDSAQSRQGPSQSNPHEPMSYTAISVSQALNEENRGTTSTSSQFAGTLSMRLNGLIDHVKMALDCFFAVWFVVGNVWIFGGHSSPADAPKLYRLCLVFLTFSCIGYAMPFILCATICCCLPCIISVLGFREDLSQTRGATSETIKALPTYKFMLKTSGNAIDRDVSDGGILAAGSEKERIISEEDAVCCICLAKYGDNDELKELPCLHVFHVECVDTWLKINAMCPLCKCEVSEGNENSTDSGVQ